MQEITSKYILQVAKIEKDTFGYEAWSEDNIKRELNNDKCVFRVLVEKDIVIGYYSFYKADNEGYINNFAVSKDFRKRGYGSKILQDLITTAKSLNIYNITLEVRESNVTARKLYEKFGFVNYGNRPKFYKTEDAIIYWLKMED